MIEKTPTEDEYQPCEFHVTIENQFIHMKRTEGFMQYLVGGLFLAFSLYQVSRNELWEFSLYAIAGAAFITMGLIKDKRFPKYQKLLNILSWILILSAGLMLIFLVRTDV